MGGFTSELRERFKGRGGNTVILAAVVRDRGGDVAKRAQELGWAAILETPLKQDSLHTAVTCLFQAGQHTPSCCRVSGTSKDCGNGPPEKSAGEPTNPPESSTSTLPNGDSAVGVLAGKRILVVDDAMINRRVASRMLERYGCAVVCAASGQEAIDLFREYLATLAGADGQGADRYHAVLMDVQMPGMDGYTATARIRELEGEFMHGPLASPTGPATGPDDADVSGRKRDGGAHKHSNRPWRHNGANLRKSGELEKTAPVGIVESLHPWYSRVPIIALTADVMKGTREKCIGAGMDEYLSKPLDKTMLGVVLQRIILPKDGEVQASS
ncbi:Signal transduction histidine kinase [Klebsormidium nitens]|uniref:Signal transduction histidine kinase n=1 Tax=Klebsormidium nitens TaxID=105231 RepID=A0A1Y1I870_KLENI|nr:Signal transduction histidine kinase [Klebsormidium nitens]|eukprot:GAQ84886.1 Signal transduction histidine kinase [Klebsormidium nitens]